MVRARWFLPFLLLALVGCVTYTPPDPSPLASPDSDAQAKQFAPPPGKGNLYVARVSEFVILGQPAPFAFFVDEREVGGIVPGMYYCFSLEPGNHTFSASSASSTDHATVTIEAGKNYFYQLTTSNTAENTCKLSLSWVILEPMGKLMVQQSKRGEAAIE
jgi:hypothetical protein